MYAKDLLKQINKITKHYFTSNIGKHAPRDIHKGWVCNGMIERKIKQWKKKGIYK